MQYKHQYSKNNSRDEWQTPIEIFQPLNSVFHFQLDAAATPNNAWCKKYYTIEDDGLKQKWLSSTFCNPPYLKGAYGDWIKKAVLEYNSRKDTFVLLLPGSWETDAFAPVWEFAHYMIFPYRRIQFVPPAGVKGGGATFTSLIPIFTSRSLKDGELNILTGIGRVVDLWRGLVPPC